MTKTKRTLKTTPMTKTELRAIAESTGLWYRPGWAVEKTREYIHCVLTQQCSHLDAMLDNQDRHKSCYFRRNLGSTAYRRRLEEQRSMAGAWTLKGVEYRWDQDVSINGPNYHYVSAVTVGGVKRDIRAMRALLGALKRIRDEVAAR